MSQAREDVEKWLAIRKEQAKLIDPETAEVVRIYGNILDPYGLHHVREGCTDSDFARVPNSDVWVFFYDLPEATRDALLERCRLELYSDSLSEECRVELYSEDDRLF